jgi:hypothetical protein
LYGKGHIDFTYIIYICNVCFSWEDDIKINLEGTGWEVLDRMHMAQALVNTNKLSGPIICREFLEKLGKY